VAVWDKIVSEQTASETYTDVYGTEHTSKRGKTREAFEECVILHLQTVFKYDAAERELHYISNVLKKPKRLSVRQLFQRVEELNATLDYLPCIYYSPKANANSEPVRSFSDCVLANHLYRMVPEAWQAEYEKTKTLPNSVRTLLADLEDIEASEKLKAMSQPIPKKEDSKRTPKDKKGHGSGPPKKPRKGEGKFCSHCKKHGGAHTTHNTSDCLKYNEDGTPKKSFVSKKDQKKGDSHKKKSNHNFAQLEKKLEKISSKLKKVSKKRKRKYVDSSDSDSDSS